MQQHKSNKAKLWHPKHTGRRPCRYCGDMITRKEATVDHIIPLSKGGSNDKANLVICCLRCNKKKGDVMPQMLLSRLAGLR